MDLIWAPECLEKLDDSTIKLYLNFSSSPCIRNGGCDIHYALEILYQSQGDIKLAMKKLLALENNDKGLKNFWSDREIQCFEENLQAFGKNFYLISRQLKTKSVKQCVEFYYLWKKSHSNHSSLISNNNINNHSNAINSSYASSSSSSSFGGAGLSTSSSISSSSSSLSSSSSIAKHQSAFQQVVVVCENNSINLTVNNNNSDINNNDNNNNCNVISKDLFLCKVCGRAFEKIKSRSAHMKRHKNERPRQ